MAEDIKDKKTDSKEASVTPEQMGEWNRFSAWLREKNLAGDKRMNNLQFSKSVMESYKKENPNANIDYNVVVPIQATIKKYREEAIQKIKEGKLKIAEGMDPGKDYENYMSWATKTPVDGRLGEFTSQFKFPDWYISDKFMKSGGQPENLERQGLITPSTTATPSAATQRVASMASYGQYRKLGTNR